MEENKINDNTDSTDNLPEENNDNNLIEVVENEKIEDPEENIQNTNSTYPSSTNKLTAVIYLVIFVSILIWVYFYVKQNPELMSKLIGKEETNSWQIETLTWEVDNITSNTDIESDNVNTGTIEETPIKEDKNTNTNEKDPSTSSSTDTSKTVNKSEEVIIKDFEKELDSLFNMIDENAK